VNATPFFDDAERGLPGAKARPTTRDGQPRGNAKFPFAHPASFAALLQSSARAYDRYHDEALRYGWENQTKMLNDPVICASLRVRVNAPTLATAHVEPENDRDPFEQKVSKIAYREISRMRMFAGWKRWLYWNGVWKGRTATLHRYEKVWNPIEKRTFENPVQWRPIDGDKLAFKWSGEVGVQVGGAWADEQTEVIPTYGRVRFFSPDERATLTLFTYEPEDGEFYQPWEAGAINGVGLRRRLFWLWALKSRLWAASIDFLEFWARGIILWYFRSGDAAHQKELVSYLKKFDGQWQRLIPRDPENPDAKMFDRISPEGGTNSFLQELITNYLDDLIRQLILGQTLTTQASPTGLGSGVAQAHQQTFEQLVRYDADFFDDAATHDILYEWYDVNYPGVPPGRWKTEVDSPNVQQLMDAAEAIYGMGGNVPEDALLEAAGLPEVKEGDTILTQVAPTQPAAVDGMAEGMPVTDANSAETPEQPEQAEQPVRMSAAAFLKLDKAARAGDRRAAKLMRRVLKRDVLFT